MSKKIIPQRKRIYFAVEGEGEQSFIKFLQLISDKNKLYVHLDCDVLGGGGYKKMLDRAINYRTRNEKKKGKTKECILIVDSDRAETDNDPWSLSQLTSEADKNDFIVCLQNPNLEGLLFRMLPGNQKNAISATEAYKKLCKEWQTYKKPADSRTLMNKFSLDDIQRAAQFDSYFKDLLTRIGFKLN